MVLDMLHSYRQYLDSYTAYLKKVGEIMEKISPEVSLTGRRDYEYDS